MRDSEMIDVCLVKYDKRGGKGICWSPAYSVYTGDVVETEFGRGTVIDTVTTLTHEKLYVLLTKAMKIDRIIGKIELIDYGDEESPEGEEDDLSEE